MKTRHVHTLGCKGTNNWHKNKIKAPQSDYFFVFPSWKSAFSHTPPVLCAIIFQHQPTFDCRQAYTQLQTNLHSIANKPTFDCRQAHADCFYLKHCTCNISAFLASHIRSGRKGAVYRMERVASRSSRLLPSNTYLWIIRKRHEEEWQCWHSHRFFRSILFLLKMHSILSL